MFSEHTMVKMSESDCLLEETSFDGAAGSEGTATVFGAPGVFSTDPRSSLLLEGSRADILTREKAGL